MGPDEIEGLGPQLRVGDSAQVRCGDVVRTGLKAAQSFQMARSPFLLLGLVSSFPLLGSALRCLELEVQPVVAGEELGVRCGAPEASRGGG